MQQCENEYISKHLTPRDAFSYANFRQLKDQMDEN